MPTPQLLVLLALTLAAGVVGGETGYPISKPGCPESCGNMSIPYPFGTTLSCSLGSNFVMNCTDNGNTALVGGSEIEVPEIILLSGEVRFLLYTVHLCQSDGSIDITRKSFFSGGSTYTLSHSKNKFTVVGCDALAFIYDTADASKFQTGCITGCQSLQDVVNGSCDGIGCCQISVPRRTKVLNYTLGSYGDHNDTSRFNSSFNPCNSTFVVEQAAYNFTSLILLTSSNL